MGLIVENVSKKYGSKVAVDGISFSLEQPGVYGLLGTNGAGKTTTIRMLLGIIKKDTGVITWNGKEVARKHVKFGYLPEERGIYPKTKIFDQLVYFARLKGMTQKQAEKAIEFWLEKLEVMQYKDMFAEKLSKGNQQKIQFITAIVDDPELIVLDEPFSGLDPVNTELLKNVILDLVKQGKYIIMSSHQMTSIEEFCTEVLILNQGRTVLQGNLKQIKEAYPANKLMLSTNKEVSKFIEQVGLNITFSKNNEYEISIEQEAVCDELLKLLVENNIKVSRFEIQKPSLHDIFIEKVGK